MKKIDLNPSECAALEFLGRHAASPMSAIGYHIRDVVPASGDRKANPSPQGMALFASRFVYALHKAGLVTPARHGWSITREGRSHLADRAAKAASRDEGKGSGKRKEPTNG